jgi:hypothetical protein
MTFAVHRRKPFVYCVPSEKYYARYIGRQCYGAFVAGRELDKYEIESFRTDPTAWLPPEEIDPLTPRAA